MLLLFLSFFNFQPHAEAQLLMFNKPGETKAMIRTQSRFYADQHIGAMFATVPIYQNNDEVWSVNLQALDVQIQEPGTLPNDGGAGQSAPVPDHFWNAGLGFQYTRNFDAKRFWSASFAVDSPSDAPYSSSRVINYVGNLFYGFPSSETSSWILLLNVSNNRPFLSGIPLPGFAYSYVPQKDFRLTLGFPFVSLYYEMSPKFSVTMFALGVSVLKAELAYRFFGPAQAYVSIDFNQDVYFRKDRIRTEDRFFYAEKKIMLGLRSPLSQVFFLDLAGGLSFDRSFFEAEKFSDRQLNERTLATSGVFAASLGARF